MDLTTAEIKQPLEKFQDFQTDECSDVADSSGHLLGAKESAQMTICTSVFVDFFLLILFVSL